MGCTDPHPCVDGLWEEVLAATIRESFATTNLVGVNLSIRRTHFKVLLWMRDAGSDVDTTIPRKLTEVLRLPEDVVIHYKTFKRALSDNSTTHHAKCFGFTPIGSEKRLLGKQVQPDEQPKPKPSLELNLLPSATEDAHGKNESGKEQTKNENSEQEDNNVVANPAKYTRQNSLDKRAVTLDPVQF